MSFTPGPWIAGETVYESGATRNIALGTTGSEFGVGSIYCVLRNGDEVDSGAGAVARVERLEANARLIAAAPELLEALAYARRFLNDKEHDTAFVDSAIAKARGETYEIIGGSPAPASTLDELGALAAGHTVT